MTQATAGAPRRGLAGAGSRLLALGVCLCLALPALALDDKGEKGDKGRSRKSEPPAFGIRQPARGGASVDRIVERIERQHRARVVRIDEAESNGRHVYVLRLLSDEGRVWTVRVDSETGGVL